MEDEDDGDEDFVKTKKRPTKKTPPKPMKRKSPSNTKAPSRKRNTLDYLDIPFETPLPAFRKSKPIQRYTETYTDSEEEPVPSESESSDYYERDLSPVPRPMNQIPRKKQKKMLPSRDDDDFEFDSEEYESAIAPRRALRSMEQKTYREDSDAEEAEEDGSPSNDRDLTGESAPYEETEQAVQEDEDVIDKIVDQRVVMVPTARPSEEGGEEEAIQEDEVPVEEYLIKWKNKAHIHNSWHRYEDLALYKGFKRLQNYIKNREAEIQWRQTASAEDKENADVTLELTKEMYNDFQQVDRIVSVRRVPGDTPDSASLTQYLVKWKSLPYADCTWEYPEDVQEYQSKIDDFLIRNANQLFPNAPVPPRNRFFKKWDKQPEGWLKGGDLRDYQLEGLNWLYYSWANNTNCILADEMGLGKTVQSITFLGFLQFEMKMPGPFLVVVPLSTMGNWESEFAKWVPDMNTVIYIGNSASRDTIRKFEFFSEESPIHNKVKFNVLLTTYEIVLKDRKELGSIEWNCLVVDEGHRLKNNESMLHVALQEFHTGNRVLLTGTPLQNSLKELWSLLHFLDPKKFAYLEDFTDQYTEIREQEQIKALHEQLQPYLLRRVKKDVEKSLPNKIERILRVDLSPMQKKYYKWILERNFQALNKGVNGQASTLLNIVMELKKSANHPYLFDNAEDADSKDPIGDMIRNSGKLVLLNKLLLRLKETGHRVLIFSQMVRMLDILSDYLRGCGFQFQRLDGSMARDERQRKLDHFNAKDSLDFCFLLSTRAGGLGINLSTADTVIIFDSDWNPQNDLQAEARAHRIGQKNVVNIYRLITRGTVEEDILQRAKNKMVLDHLVIQTMGDSGAREISEKTHGNQPFNKDELAALLRFGAKELFKEEEGSQAENKEPEMDIDEILARAETTEGIGGAAGDDLLNAFKVANFKTNDTEFWTEVIPKSAQEQAKEKSHVVEYLAPRRVKKKNYDESGDFDEDGTFRKKPRTADKPRNSNSHLHEECTEKEIRSFVGTLNRFGELSRLSEVFEETSVGKHRKVVAEAVLEEIIQQCKEAVSENTTDKKVFIDYEGVRINATDLLQRMSDMENLSQQIESYSNPEQFRFTAVLTPAAIKAWTVENWTPKDDASLLIGVHRHGFGKWDDIIKDKSFGLAKKNVSGAQCKTRVEALFRALRTERMNQKSKRSTREEKKKPRREREKENSREKRSRGEPVAIETDRQRDRRLKIEEEREQKERKSRRDNSRVFQLEFNLKFVSPHVIRNVNVRNEKRKRMIEKTEETETAGKMNVNLPGISS
eukprot:TRINITY_DN1929_c1_g1_i2.p1 TRINITY_DN1929_c1_g1~~TRINITY_DN1929_c1_g1_i2.p1  ORF type:complete len:1376 (+),score=395.63 TRINITY_DN1929_c1_g1_i2:257-4129(+)